MCENNSSEITEKELERLSNHEKKLLDYELKEIVRLVYYLLIIFVIAFILSLIIQLVRQF